MNSDTRYRTLQLLKLRNGDDEEQSTPAPPEDQIEGSKTNPKGSAEGDSDVDIEFSEQTEKSIQTIIDKTVNLFSDNLNLEAKTTVHLVNGYRLQVAKEYLHLRGHDLEDLICKKFPSLNGIKKKSEHLLKKHIIDKIIDDLPEFISQDILDAFIKVQED